MSAIPKIDFHVDSKIVDYTKICEIEWLEWYEDLKNAIIFLDTYKTDSDKAQRVYQILCTLTQAPKLASELKCKMATYLAHQYSKGTYDLDIKGIPWIKLEMSREQKKATKDAQLKFVGLWEQVMNPIREL
jgi:hypothetical protein